MKRFLSVFFILSALVMSLSGQSVPPSTGELAYRLSSPVYLGGGLHQTRINTPQGVFVNPAAAAGFQRVILDVNYTNLQALGGDAAGVGNAVNLAMSFPTKVGVVTGGFGFLETSAYEGTPMDLGVSGRANLAFSKEIYSDVWFGAALDGQIGELDGNLHGGGAMNFGFIHFPDTFGDLKNFRWGGSISGLGYRYGSTARKYFNAIPGNLTPALGIAFDIADSEKFRWTFRGDVRAPSITDLWVGLGNDLYFGDVARLSVSSSLALRDAFDGSWETIIPSAALGLHFPIGGGSEEDENKLTTTEMDIQIAAAPLYAGVWGFSGGVTLPFGVRDSNPPRVSAPFDPPAYISPNYDGVQDELIIPYSVTDERYISSYLWRVEDEDGNTVRSYVNKDERPENESVRNLWSRLVSPKEGTPLPEVVRWDGVSDSGSVTEDGSYNVYLEFSDDNDNTSVTGPFPVIVDTLAPELNLEEPEGLDLIFSPDGDGFKDVFRIEQSGSLESLWEAEFQDASGNRSRGWARADIMPEALEWNGTDDDGEVVPDGVYRYVISSTDLAGNFTDGTVEGIIIDTKQPEVGLTIDKAIFSPGTSSPVSTVGLIPQITVRTGIVDWTMDILNSSGAEVRTWSRREIPAIPGVFEFDGKNSDGRRLPEGDYRGRLRLVYGNGYRPEVISPAFTVDVTAPEADVAVNFEVFSPQSGSLRNQVTMTQTSSSEDIWIGRLSDSEGETVKEWTWIETAGERLVWDGRDSEGRLVPDGMYSYQLIAEDKAGNVGTSTPVSVRVDTTAVDASLTASLDVFGPTGNGVKDTVDFFISSKTDAPVSNWSLVVENRAGEAIRRWNGTGEPNDRISWNGRTDGGTRAVDGGYTASLTLNYVKGDVAAASAGEVILDTEPPRIESRVDDRLFSPDGDGRKDTLFIIQESSDEEVFEAVVTDSDGTPVRSLRWTGTLDSFEWDGTDDSGNRLPDGDYRYQVSGTDLAGNTTALSIPGLRIDTAPTPVYLTAAEGFIKAGETDPERFQSFAAVVPNVNGIESWVFGVEDEDGQTVYTERGTGAVPDGFVWNGTDGNRRPVEGIFIGALRVNYLKGANPRAESRPFVSDGSPPEVTVTMTPQPFTPDDDNVDDDVVIALTVEDNSRIAEWSLDITDPRGRDFITFAGRGRPSERIIWDGRSGRGDLVESAEDYSYVLRVTDVLGQTSVKRGEIAVGILVIREGDRLKIQINNITFQPSSPQLLLDGEQGEKNIQVLDRLAEIMLKYNSYRIIVEGHAVSLNWENKAAAEREQRDILVPLSRSRAQTVVNELVARGVPSNRMIAEGIGGADPIVPHGDLEERWRNRRVEFYLEK
jgi:flagellar hook assembly protein FlgD/outer membrane protein OmpA-like peptidoglycan-associated protein